MASGTFPSRCYLMWQALPVRLFCAIQEFGRRPDAVLVNIRAPRRYRSVCCQATRIALIAS